MLSIGLCGIAMKVKFATGAVLHPLMNVTKQDIILFLSLKYCLKQSSWQCFYWLISRKQNKKNYVTLLIGQTGKFTCIWGCKKNTVMICLCFAVTVLKKYWVACVYVVLPHYVILHVECEQILCLLWLYMKLHDEAAVQKQAG